MTARLNDFAARASASSAARSIPFTWATSTRRVAAHRALALDRSARAAVRHAAAPPAQPAASRFHRFAMAALAVNGRRRTCWSATSRLALTEPSYTSDTLARLHATRPGRVADFLHHRRRRVRGNCDLEPLSRGARPGALRRRLAAGPSRSARCRRGCRGSRRRHAQPAATLGDDRRAGSRVIFLVDAPTPDVSSTDVRRRLAAGAVDRRARARAVEHLHRSTPALRAPARRDGSANHLHDQNRTDEDAPAQRQPEEADRRSRRARCAPRSTRRRRTSWCSTCATRRRSPTSSCCARARTRGRSRRSPTASRRRCARPRSVRRTSKATTAPSGC